ncbi:hypothetical protein CDAR_290361 [Caerostris darwini]|uniref:Uncharacterized protein n=1 Tax=Caerostris darwini TaxID=1538125 RepID=A0AAV4N4B0_9ARAC|nr:hypothetical protein CDAR_290361 [Caerostris darwini]
MRTTTKRLLVISYIILKQQVLPQKITILIGQYEITQDLYQYPSQTKSCINGLVARKSWHHTDILARVGYICQLGNNTPRREAEELATCSAIRCIQTSVIRIDCIRNPFPLLTGLSSRVTGGYGLRQRTTLFCCSGDKRSRGSYLSSGSAHRTPSPNRSTGSYLTSGNTTSHRTPSPNRSTLSASSHLSSTDRSPGRSSSQYLSPYPRTWQQGSLSPKRYSVADHHVTREPRSTDRSSRLTDYGWSTDHHHSLSPSSYMDYSYLQPARDRSPGHRTQKSRTFIPTRNTVWTDLSLRFPKANRYSAKIGDNYKRNDAPYTGTYDRSKIPETRGWRDRLAQQGYVASTRKSVRRATVPERKWHYLDEDEIGEEEETGFEFRTSQGTQSDSGEQHHDSVISRIRRMKLQQLSEVAATDEMSVQVDPEDLHKHQEQEELRIARSFISSRHHSWYDTVPINYKKYLSPMPWKGGSSYSSTRCSRTTDVEKESSPTQETSKDFRKSVLNVDLPETEAEIFAERQAETRWRRTAEDNYYTSEDGSPSETGYDSSYTDADISSVDTEGVFTDSLDRSYRSTPYREDGHFLESIIAGDAPNDYEQHQMLREQFVDNTDLNSDVDAEGVSDEIPRADLIAENLCFRFKSLNEESSQRDSGFSEICNQTDLLNMNIPPDQDATEHQRHDDKNKKDILISGCNDIDQLLMDKDLTQSAFETFEDFDRMIERHKSNVRTRQNCDEDLYYCEPKWSKPAKSGLRLDLQTCKQFIGTCQDIDEMLGMPTPLSPDSENTTLREKIENAANLGEEEGDGVSTVATSIIGTSDIADLTWLAEHDTTLDQSALNHQKWPPNSQQANKVS